ncbi:11794_t:CDS:2, partial [Gigaspora rosea]
MNKDQLRELLEGLTTFFAEVANTIANTKKNLEDKRELTHVKVDPFHRSDDEDPIEWDLATDWYKGKRDDLTQWKNDKEEESSFYHKFINFFATPERRHGCQIELQELKQQKHEKVDTYATKFKKLLKRVDPDDEIPDPYITQMFLSGLQRKAATFDLDEAITKARKAEAGKYYSKQTSNKSHQRK